MASAKSQLANSSRHLVRAQRVPDSEWEAHRDKLLELYLEKNVSRDDIVHTMAQENGLSITSDTPCLQSMTRADHEK